MSVQNLLISNSGYNDFTKTPNALDTHSLSNSAYRHDLALFDADCRLYHEYKANELSIRRTEFVTSLMSLDEVAHRLIRHGCTDISNDLDLAHCAPAPFARGGFGEIYRGLSKSGQSIAIKCMDALGRWEHSDQTHKNLKRAAKELYIWSRSSHPGILKPLGFARFKGQIALISPWMDSGSLRAYLTRHLETNRVQFCIQVAQALEHLHSSGIVHGDIKPDNIIISDDGRAQLADFGSAMLTESFSLNFTQTTCKYTLRFAAPEILDDTSKHTTKTDIYALGMTILNVISGKQPFYRKRNHAIMMEVTLKKGRPCRSDYNAFAESNWVNDRLWNLLERCWAHVPKNRPTAAEVSQVLIEIERGSHMSSKQSLGNVVERSLPSHARRDILVALIDACFFLLFLWGLTS